MLWIAQKLGVDVLKITTAKALCASTVRHLMQDERSRHAIDVAIKFGDGDASADESSRAADAAADDAAAAAADAAYAAAYAAADADAAAAKKKNRKETADICRRILTNVVFESIDKLKVTE